jgi:hypothetical protein
VRVVATLRSLHLAHVFNVKDGRMNPEARRILEVFQAKGLRAGGFIHYTDFGDAIVWEGGFVRDQSVREALVYLFAEHYVVELAAGLRLTDKGALHLNPTVSP